MVKFFFVETKDALSMIRSAVDISGGHTWTFPLFPEAQFGFYLLVSRERITKEDAFKLFREKYTGVTDEEAQGYFDRMTSR